MELKGKFHILVCLLLTVVIFLPMQAKANPQGERVVVLDFLALDEQGNYIDTTSLKLADLVNLSRIMSQGIGAKLVQYGEFDVQNSISLREEIESLEFSYDTPAWERASTLLQTGLADQIITGSITMLQTTAVIGVQRFQMVAGKPALVGSAMSTTPKMADAPGLVDNLVSNLFPADIQVIERSIDQVFVIPGQLRVNLGRSKQIIPYALDSLGRPVTNPQFLFFSSDEAKVEVDEKGVVTGVQPGSSTITVRAISKTTRSGSPATMNVTVVPPSLGVRLGTLITSRSETDRYPLRLGLRLTPTIDQKGSQTQTSTLLTPPTVAGTVGESTNPLTLIASFFSSMLTNGLMTIDLDLDPTEELLVAFSAVQRSSGGYISTGVGYLSPLNNVETKKGFVLRLSAGTQYQAGNRIALPAEAVMDAIFPTSTSFNPTFRIGVNLGLDFFP